MKWREAFARLLGTPVAAELQAPRRSHPALLPSAPNGGDSGRALTPEVSDVLDAAAHVPAGLSRRHFLRGALALTAIATTVDVDQLLWTPGEKTIFVPPAPDLGISIRLIQGFHVTSDWYVREMLHHLKNNLQFTSFVNREYTRFDVLYGAAVVDVGQTVSIVTDGWTAREAAE